MEQGKKPRVPRRPSCSGIGLHVVVMTSTWSSLLEAVLKFIFLRFPFGAEAMKHQIDHGDQDQGLAALGKHFVVAGQAAVATQPRKGSFNNPAKGQDFEHPRVVLDNLQPPMSERQSPVYQFARVAPVGHDQPQPGKSSFQAPQHTLGSVTILHVGGMNDHRQQKPQAVHYKVSLAPRYLLPRIVAPAPPPFSVVLTLWLSTIAALGLLLRPAFRRVFSRKVSCTFSHTPAFRQRRKYVYTVCHFGKSCGRSRHAHPVRNKYRMALMISRSGTSRGRRLHLGLGNNGSINFHCSSVRSVGYTQTSALTVAPPAATGLGMGYHQQLLLALQHDRFQDAVPSATVKSRILKHALTAHVLLREV